MYKKHLLTIIGSFVYLLCLMGSIFAETIALADLMRPSHIAVDKKQVYISDGTTVHIYSLADFKRTHTFGKKGEGPQEFRVPGSFGVEPMPQKNRDLLLINSLGKVSYFDKKGTFIKELKTGTVYAFYPIGEHFIAGNDIVENNDTFHTLNLYDASFKKVREIIRWLHPIQESRMEILLVPLYTRAHCYDNKIFAAPGSGFVIDVFDLAGKKLYSIEHSYKKLAVTEEYKKTTLDFFKTDPRWRKNFNIIKTMGRFPDNFHAIRYFLVADEKVYVQTYGEKEGNSEFVIFDIKGKFLKKVYVPFVDDMGINIVPRHTIANGNLYQLVENDDSEEWELHIHKLMK
jgi:hypothetical protein